MAKRKSARRVGTGGRAGAANLQDLVQGASGRAEDAIRRGRESLQQTLRSFEKRRDVELRNLQGRLKDLNTTLGGLERRYRQLEKRMQRQIEELSRGTVKASDVDRRLRQLEAEIRRLAGLGPARKPAARKPAARKPAARKPAARKAAARKPAARKPARKAAPRKTRTVPAPPPASGPAATGGPA